MNDLTETSIRCPYCGETITVVIEVLGEDQEYIEDCQVCCRPIVFDISVSIAGEPTVSARSENDTFGSLE